MPGTVVFRWHQSHGAGHAWHACTAVRGQSVARDQSVVSQLPTTSPDRRHRAVERDGGAVTPSSVCSAANASRRATGATGVPPSPPPRVGSCLRSGHHHPRQLPPRGCRQRDERMAELWLGCPVVEPGQLSDHTLSTTCDWRTGLLAVANPSNRPRSSGPLSRREMCAHPLHRSRVDRRTQGA